ncbi:hypothetical protein CEXT_539611, partial [Caerostris extrusa]
EAEEPHPRPQRARAGALPVHPPGADSGRGPGLQLQLRPGLQGGSAPAHQGRPGAAQELLHLQGERPLAQPRRLLDHTQGYNAIVQSRNAYNGDHHLLSHAFGWYGEMKQFMYTASLLFTQAMLVQWVVNKFTNLIPLSDCSFGKHVGCAIKHMAELWIRGYNVFIVRTRANAHNGDPNHLLSHTFLAGMEEMKRFMYSGIFVPQAMLRQRVVNKFYKSYSTV